MTGNQGDDDKTAPAEGSFGKAGEAATASFGKAGEAATASFGKAGDGKTSGPQGAAAAEDLDGDGQLERLDAEYALMMRAFDKLFGKGASGDLDADEPIDPGLERDMQQAIANFLANPPARDPLASDDPEKRLDHALETQIRPLFEAIFATAETHAKGAAAAIREGRAPPTRTSPNATLDLSGLLDEDDS